MSKMTICLLLAFLCATLLVEVSIAIRPQPKRTPRPQLLGGWRKIDHTSSEVQGVATKATEHLAGERNSARLYRLQQVLSAKSQIVNGVNYQLKILIGQTECLRQTNPSLENCPAIKVQKCSVTLWIRGDSESRLTNYTCGKEKPVNSPRRQTTRSPMMPGGEVAIDVSSEEARNAATFATSELTARSNGAYTVQHQRIIKGTSQVVAGAMYKLTIEVSVNFSQNGQTKKTRCDVKVWDQAWRTPRFILNEYKCNKHIA